MTPLSSPALLVRLWSVAGRHPDLSVSGPALAVSLAEPLTLSRLRVDERSDDGWLSRLDWFPEQGYYPPVALDDGEFVPLRGLPAEGEVSSAGADGRWPAPWQDRPPLPAGLPGLTAPLHDESGELVGRLTVLGVPGETFDEAQVALIAEALPVLAAAVANDRRWRELGEQKQAAVGAPGKMDQAERKPILDTVVGSGQGLRQVMQRVAQVAPTDASVLILGETGAGKEVVARCIHELSARRGGAFVRVNCGAVPPELIDSELFGHEKGSFTGAMGHRRGWFERADGGTLFLDEIGELTPQVQVRLLRVLQDGVVQRVGSEREIQVNVRVVAATHRDLPSFVQEGRFREDLWYRLAVFPIILPPLRERHDDIPLLAEHFTRRAAQRLGLPPPPLRAADFERLRAYRWPGNVRELSVVIERAVILGQGNGLDLDTALGPVVPAPSPGRNEPGGGPGPFSSEVPLSLEAALDAHLRRTLRYCQGKVDGPGGAAEVLQINPSTLRAKLRKLGLNPAAFRGAG